MDGQRPPSRMEGRMTYLLKCMLAAASVAALASAGVARADAMYTNQAAFDAGAGPLTTIDFNDIAAPGSFVSYGTGPLTLSGVTFTGNGSMFVIDPGYYGASYPNGGFLNSDYATTGVDTILATLPANVKSVGFDFGGLLGSPVTFQVTLSDGHTFTATSNNSITGTGALDFAGFAASTPISSIQINMPDAPNYNAIDNFTFGSGGVPEPATWAMLIVGVAMIGFAARRRSLARAVPA